MSTSTMAPKKIRREKSGPKTVAFRVSAEYAKWLDELAAHNRTTVAGLLDQSLAKYAQQAGFTKPAPER